MFDRLYRLTDNVAKLDRNEIFTKVVTEQKIKTLILHLNRMEQLFKDGIDADGDQLHSKKRDSYSGFTEFINAGRSFTFEGVTKQKIAGQRYFLYDSGFFFKSFNVRVYKDGFTITANDETENGTELAEKFGTKILGLTTQSKDELAQTMVKGIIQETRNRILR